MNSSGSDLHRCFVALPVPDSLRQTLIGTIDSLRRDDSGSHPVVRWTPSANLHMTLRFFGEIDESRFMRARQWVDDLDFSAELHLTLGDIDGFPSLKAPSVLVVGLHGTTDSDRRLLEHIQRMTEEFAVDLGLQPEQRQFKPHITIGRVRRGARLSDSLRSGLSECTPKEFGPTAGRSDRLQLMESRLTPSGARYSVAAEIPIGSSA